MSIATTARATEDHNLSTVGQPASAEAVFEALLAPHRSLSRGGTVTLMAAVAIVSTAIALRFWFIGAWPVMTFSVIEVSLAVLLLAINLRRARAREFIKLSSAEITVVQTDQNGRRRSFSLPSAWLQIKLDTAEDRCSRLLLNSRGFGREIGAFLHEPEKLSLFEALRDALQALRQPRFDNEQLRES